VEQDLPEEMELHWLRPGSLLAGKAPFAAFLEGAWRSSAPSEMMDDHSVLQDL
jgi:hypothetical protein